MTTTSSHLITMIHVSIQIDKIFHDLCMLIQGSEDQCSFPYLKRERERGGEMCWISVRAEDATYLIHFINIRLTRNEKFHYVKAAIRCCMHQ